MKYGRVKRTKREVINMICDQMGTNKSITQIANTLYKFEGIPKNVTKKLYETAREQCLKKS